VPPKLRGRDCLGCLTARCTGSCDNGWNIWRRPLEALVLDALHRRQMDPELVEAFVSASRRNLSEAITTSPMSRAAGTASWLSAITAPTLRIFVSLQNVRMDVYYNPFRL
jgi:hypothetical protein